MKKGIFLFYIVWFVKAFTSKQKKKKKAILRYQKLLCVLHNTFIIYSISYYLFYITLY